MIDLICGNPRNLVFNCMYAARLDRKLSLAAEREHSTRALDFDLTRQLWYGKHRRILLTQQESTERWRAFAQRYEDLPVGFGADLEAVRRRILFVRRN